MNSMLVSSTRFVSGRTVLLATVHSVTNGTLVVQVARWTPYGDLPFTYASADNALQLPVALLAALADEPYAQPLTLAVTSDLADATSF